MGKIYEKYMKNKKENLSINKIFSKINKYFTAILKFSLVSTLFLIAALLISGAGIIVEDGSFNVSNNLLVNTNTLFVDSTNSRVGIGTTSPSALLHVLGDGLFGSLASASDFGDITINKQTDAIFAAHASGEGIAYLGYDSDQDRMVIGTDGGGGANDIGFFTSLGVASGGDNFASDTVPEMIIKQGGNVGIGTANPGKKLTVVGQINATGDAHFGGAMGYSPFGLSIKQGANNKVEGFALQANGALDTWAWAVLDDGRLYLTRANNTSGADGLGDFSDIVTITIAGNVGIGTTSPNATLSVGSGKTTIADEWTVRSDRDIKTNIVNYEHANILDNPLTVYKYKYKYQEPVYDADGEITGFEDKISREHIGIIADEAPAELLGADGQGIDLYAFSSYIYYHALKQQEYIKQLEQRIAALEAR